MTENQLKYLAYQENVRHNQATELDASRRTDETVRSNLANEKETNRSNVARETETNRSNVARETETNRSNRVNEGLAAQDLVEKKRANRAREEETRRHNMSEEIIGATNVSLQGLGQLTPDKLSLFSLG